MCFSSDLFKGKTLKEERKLGAQGSHTDVKQPGHFCVCPWEQKTLKPAHTHTHATRVATVRVGERGLGKQGEMKSVFESKQRLSDQDQIGADQTVVLK